MVLAVDIGNSNIVLGCFEGDRVVFEERLSTNRNATELEYTVTIRTLLDLYGLTASAFEGGIVSSVVPGVTQIVRSAVRRVIGKDALVLGPGVKTGLNIKLENPGSLGSDRVADAVGAIGSYPCPLIIVDMGTATTISVVDRDKQFLGGMIMPGLRVAVDSLARDRPHRGGARRQVHGRLHRRPCQHDHPALQAEDHHRRAAAAEGPDDHLSQKRQIKLKPTGSRERLPVFFFVPQIVSKISTRND